MVLIKYKKHSDLENDNLQVFVSPNVKKQLCEIYIPCQWRSLDRIRIEICGVPLQTVLWQLPRAVSPAISRQKNIFRQVSIYSPKLFDLQHLKLHR
jgi:hypothetical protein